MFAVIYGMWVVGLFADCDEAFAFHALCSRNKGKFPHSCMLEVKEFDDIDVGEDVHLGQHRAVTVRLRRRSDAR